MQMKQLKYWPYCKEGIILTIFTIPRTSPTLFVLKLNRGLLQSVQIVIERQLSEYLEGRLYNCSPELSAQCSSAPVHNMFAERTLALSDFHLRRASNVQWNCKK